jgi:Tol biopolymer transport system component
VWETFPAFSADGRSLYFCSAQSQPIPERIKQIRYSLCRVDFDPATGRVGEQVDTLVNAEALGKSVSFPRPSYNGRWLVYVLSDYGNFSIWHPEADLWLMDLQSGEQRPLDEVNSQQVESYHGWSANSRWMVFSSRRDDGLFTRLYLTHIDAQGRFSKPFMLPQRHPRRYYDEQMNAYNIPEFVTRPVALDKMKAAALLRAKDRKPMQAERQK